MTDYAPLLARLHDEQARVVMSQAHRYKCDGKAMPSVSTIIKKLDAPQLDNWRVKVQVEGTARAAYQNPPMENEPEEAYVGRLKKLGAELYENERLAKEAADIGKAVHQLIEFRCRTMLGEKLPRPVVSEAAAFREAGWEKWAKDVRLKPLAVEARLVNREHNYCGTLDLLALVEGVPLVLDWKGARSVYESHHLQGVGYRRCLMAMGWPRIDGAVLLMPEGQDPRLEPLSDTEATWEAFLACRRLLAWKP